MNRRMPNGTYGGVRGKRKFSLLDWDKYDLKSVKLVAHPGVFVPKRYMGLDVGAPFSRQDCIDHGLQVD